MLRRSLPRFRNMLILSETDVKKALDMKQCLEANRVALQGVFTKDAVVPSRIGLPFGKDWTLFKPAAFPENLGIKVVSVRSENPSRGLPMVPATVLHINPESGIVEAVVSATYLTAARTASGSALTVQLFLDSVDHLVLFGAGLQARLHVEAIHAALDKQLFGRITIINRSMKRAEDLRELIKDLVVHETVDIVLQDDSSAVAEVLGTADVICTTTGSPTPLWPGTVALKEKAIITGVGSYTPDQCEIPLECVQSCETIYIDTPEAKAVGDLKEIPDSSSEPNMVLLGEVLGKDRKAMKRTGRVFFKSVGTAIQDVLTAANVVEKAKLEGLGTTIDMD